MKKHTQAIYLFRVNDELRAMNYASLGETERRDGVRSVYAFLTEQHGITTSREKRPCGRDECLTSIVLDRAGLIEAAVASGITVLHADA